MTYMKEYARWLESLHITAGEKAELESVGGDEKAIKDMFFAPLAFGTAGLRGVMGPGLNRMNAHVVRQTTQAIATLILSEGNDAAQRGAAICYDCRNNSGLFAREAACVFAANGVRVRLFEDMRPTPELSFAIRHYGCVAGVNITASHNPKEYNGYKAYWSDGAQLPPEHADTVVREIERIDIFTGARSMPFDEAVKSGLITMLGRETDDLFLERVLALAVSPEAVAKAADSLKVIYTPFHGTGRILVPRALQMLGLKRVLCVSEQMEPDGDFPTVKSPNPEDKEGFALALELAKKESASLIIGTDPDCDRVGIMLRDNEGGYVTLSGNQVGVLLLDYLIKAKKQHNTLPARPAALKTIVTTEMARAVALANGVDIFDTFTGFKFLAEKIKELEEERGYGYILAFEESYGYLAGAHCRDKDAVTASMLIAEMAAWHLGRGKTLYDAMEELYEEYGFYGELTLNLVMPGLEGMERMRALMSRLRSEPPASVAGVEVAAVRDYLSGERRTLEGEAEKLDIKGSDVLYWELGDGTAFIVRPSGTEPKIKIYILTRGSDRADRERRLGLYRQYAAALTD